MMIPSERISIVGRESFLSMDLDSYTHAILIDGEGHKGLRSEWKGKRLELTIGHSAESIHSASNWTIAKMHEMAIEFCQDILSDPQSRIICKCYYGRNRSACAAFIVLLTLLWDVNEAFKWLYQIKPDARPSDYIMKLIETYFGFNLKSFT